jgi:hypothetical protein
VSPRELAFGDFNGDGNPDSAVINRVSEDVSVLKAFGGAVAFQTLDQLYTTDADVANLLSYDDNGDGRDDIVQLHRKSNEISIRLADERGRLSKPSYHSIGS